MADIITHVLDPWAIPTATSTTTDQPMSVADFRAKFERQTVFADKIDRSRSGGKRLIVVKGKVKSGKSLFPRYISAIHKPVAGHEPKINNYFLSSYNRKSDRGQFNDHKAYGLKTYALFNKQQVQQCLDEIEMDLAAGRFVILHIDELDYGSSWRGLLARIWNAVKDAPNVLCVLYSATPEELLKSEAWTSLPETKKDIFEYTPVEEYCGDATFLQHGLVTDAEPAFTVRYEGETPHYELGAQFKGILNQARTNVIEDKPRYIIVLRLCYELPGCKAKTKKDKRAFALFLNQFDQLFHTNGFRVIYDKEDAGNISVKHASPLPIDWGNRAAWESHSMPTILLIDSKCTRSTEIKFHDFIYAWHEWRPSYTYTISVQAEQRVVHYTGKAYPTFNPIEVFGNVDSWRKSAGLLTDDEYLSKDTEIRLRIEVGFEPSAILKLLREHKFTGASYLTHVSALRPAEEHCFRISKQKEADSIRLRSLLEEKKATLKYKSYTIRERTNIDGIAPRVSSESRGARVQLRTEFFPWPLRSDGSYEEYGQRNTEGSLAHMIDCFCNQGEDDDSEGSTSSTDKHFHKFMLDNRFETDIPETERSKLSIKQIHTKAPDGRYISLFQPPCDGRHQPCTYEEIKDATTGIDNPRQTLIYKDGVLGVFVRMPTGEKEFNTTSETTGSSMYASSVPPPSSSTGRGRGRGRGR